jgi:hypothetical protein
VSAQRTVKNKGGNMKNKNENQNYRVIVKINEIVISFIAEDKEQMGDQLKFLYQGINIPEKSIYNDDGTHATVEINEKVIVSVVNEILDCYNFRLSEYRKYVEEI